MNSTNLQNHFFVNVCRMQNFLQIPSQHISFALSRTPLRISFFGGGTDYPAFYQRHSGAVLGTTIDKYVYISAKTMNHRFFDHTIRISYSKTELIKHNLDEIEHPSVRESLRHRGIEKDLEIHIISDLPARTGLGSSSSFTVGFLNLLDALAGKRKSKQQLALEACYVEQDKIKEAVGSQDQFHAAFGGLNLIEFNSEKIEVTPIVLTQQKREDLEKRLIVFYTGITRDAVEIAKEQIEKTSCCKLDAQLLEMKQSTCEAQRILMESEGEEMVCSFGKLLHQNWLLKRDLTSKISSTLIDQAYEAALKAGAYGGKLCGAGGGGFLLCFAPLDKIEKIKKTLAPLRPVDISFESEGSKIIYMKD